MLTTGRLAACTSSSLGSFVFVTVLQFLSVCVRWAETDSLLLLMLVACVRVFVIILNVSNIFIWNIFNFTSATPTQIVAAMHFYNPVKHCTRIQEF